MSPAKRLLLIISFYLEKTPSYYAPSPSPPKLSSYQSRPLQAPLLSTLPPPLQTTPFSESTPSNYPSTRVSQPTCPRMMRIYLTICVTGSAVKILALDKLKIECARFSNSAQLSIFQLNLRTHVLFFYLYVIFPLCSAFFNLISANFRQSLIYKELRGDILGQMHSANCHQSYLQRKSIQEMKTLIFR